MGGVGRQNVERSRQYWPSGITVGPAETAVLEKTEQSFRLQLTERNVELLQGHGLHLYTKPTPKKQTLTAKWRAYLLQKSRATSKEHAQPPGWGWVGKSTATSAVVLYSQRATQQSTTPGN